jgi:CHAT domain-containing protein/tetratricopeptide (TPR) repeat protein
MARAMVEPTGATDDGTVESILDRARVCAAITLSDRSPSAFADAVAAVRAATEVLDDGDPRLPMFLATLAWNLNQQGDVEAALIAWEHALAASPRRSPFAADIARDLGEALDRRLSEKFNAADLSRAIDADQRAVDEARGPSDDTIRALVRLALNLSRRVGLSPSAQDLDRAIDAWRQLIPLVDEGKATFQWNLAAMLLQRQERAGRAEDLDQAIDCLEAAATGSSEPVERANRLAGLADGYRRRFELGSDLSDIDRSIAAATQAAALPVPAAVGDARAEQAGALLRMKARFTCSRADATAAVSWFSELERSASGDRAADWANDLRAALIDRWTIAGELGPEADVDLDAAIDAGRRSLARGPGSTDRAARLMAVAGLLDFRFGSRGSLDDLDETIEVVRAATSETMAGHERASVLAFLGRLLFVRYSIRGMLAMADFAEGKQSIEEAIRLEPDSAQIADRLLTLLLFREEMPKFTFVAEGEEDVILERLQEAIEHAPDDWLRRPEGLERLARALARRASRQDRPADLDLAIELAEEAASIVRDQGGPVVSAAATLADLLSRRHACARVKRDRESAVEMYRLASTAEADTNAVGTAQASSAWASWALRRRAWQEAVEAFAIATAASDRLYRAQLTRESRERSLVGAAAVWTAAGYALAKRDRLADAVEHFERGRARLISDVLELDRADVEALRSEHPGLSARYDNAATSWRHVAIKSAWGPQLPTQIHLHFGADDVQRLLAGEDLAPDPSAEDPPAEPPAAPPPPSPDRSAAHRETAREELEAVISAIRELPGYERFLNSGTAEDVELAAASSPLVYLAPTAVGGLALIVAPGGAMEPVWLPKLTTGALSDEIDRYRAADKAHREAEPPADAEREALSATLDCLTGWLWPTVMGPVVAKLESAGHSDAVLIPGGLLGVLPLSAAWRKPTRTASRRSHALDRVLLTVAPNAVALTACRDAAARWGDRCLLAVQAPAVDGAPELPWSPVEVAAVKATFPEQVTLGGQDATAARVLDEWSDADVAHLSCHGAASLWSPLESTLAMADGPLTLRSILARRTTTRLAVLSACETALTGAALPDEMVGFPTGLIQAGAGGVIASLWSVPDRSTAILMFRLYEQWRVNGREPAVALRDAQQWLRDTTNRDKLDYFQARLPGSAHPMAAAAEAIWRELALAPALDLDARDHQLPYYWAAFQYVGA